MDHEGELSVGPAPERRRGFVRLGLRLVTLAAFALASSQPFWSVLTTLLALAAMLSVVIAVIRRESVFGSGLTHWDEGALYALLSRGILMMSTATPPVG